MKILVFSDSHGDLSRMRSAVEMHKPQMVLHLGDGTSEFRSLAPVFADIDFRAVRGNCDVGVSFPDSLYFNIGGKNVFMTHGHNFNVKFGLDRIYLAALEKNADLLLFGHTHRALSSVKRGMTVLNPGSIGEGRPASFGFVTIDDDRINASIRHLALGILGR